MDDYTEILKKLKRKKEAMMWTYDMLVKKSGYSKFTVGRLFRGDNVGINVFMDICDVMGVEVRVI